jgi:hypothetical protein
MLSVPAVPTPDLVVIEADFLLGGIETFFNAVLCSSRHQYILVGYRTIKDHGSVIARE